MKIQLLNRQHLARVPRAPLIRLTGWTLRRLRTEPSRWAEVTFVLLDDAGIRDVNRAVFNKDRPTDVITQPYRAVPPEHRESGEIFVNVERALREGARRPGGPARELALYLTHGCLHLNGECDEDPDSRARMRRLERECLGAASRDGRLDGFTVEVDAE